MPLLLALLLQGVDQKAIDDAVAKGVAWLKTAPSPSFANPEDGWHVPNSDELILWTFVHAGVSESDPKFKACFQKMIDTPLGRTYKAALQAMILEEVDRKSWQKRISHCAHFLVDNQCRNGQWGYGDPVAAPPPPGVPSGGAPVRSAGGRDGGARVKPAVTKRLNVTQTRFVGESGDNSNSQYAALGLRACHEAGINIPKNVLNQARNWWTSTAVKDGDRTSVASGVGGVPQGWGYRINDGAEPYGSMTAGAVGALAIYDYLLDKDWKKDPAVQGGLAWLAKNYSVENNPGAKVHFGDGGPKSARYYYLYALERAGILTENPLLGTKDWYFDGARVLLAAQGANGAWDKDGAGENATWQTCFAILFLKKATQPLIASVDR
jgi:hypothetical protein